MAIRDLEAAPGWTPYSLDAIMQGVVAGTQLKMGAVMWPMRIALSGQKVTPGGVTELLYLLGQEEAIERLKKGLKKVSE